MESGSKSNFVSFLKSVLTLNWNESVITRPIITDFDINKTVKEMNIIMIMADTEEPNVTSTTNRFNIMSYQFELVFQTNKLENLTLMQNEAKSILVNYHNPDVGDYFKHIDRAAWDDTSATKGHLTFIYVYPVMVAKRSVSIPT